MTDEIRAWLTTAEATHKKSEHDLDWLLKSNDDLPVALKLLKAALAVVEEARTYNKNLNEAQALLELTFGRPEEEHVLPEEMFDWKLRKALAAFDAAAVLPPKPEEAGTNNKG